MMHAYDKLYLSKAQSSLASLLDFAVYDLHYPLKDFYQKFLESKFSTLFENGDPSVIAGRSGIELAMDVLDDYTLGGAYHPPANRSPEYWAGWSLAYFQWYCGLSFKKINEVVPIEEVREMYSPYHEMDITQFCDHMLSLYKARKRGSNLKAMRQRSGMTQSELAARADIPLRTIQQYEQRQKNINSAKAITVAKLAKALYCPIEDLLEVE